jgi:hypothetical protein
MRMIRRALKTKPEHLPEDHPERQPGLLVDRSCTALIWEMREGYRWPEGRGDGKNSSEIPLDDNNHGPEALSRYFKGHLESSNAELGTGSRQSRIGMRKRAA